MFVAGPQKNGMSLNSGPPRLRIDNVINLRIGTSADDDFEARKRVPPPQPIPPRESEHIATQEDSDGKRATGKDDVEESRGPSPEVLQGVTTRDMAIQNDDHNDSTHDDDKERKRQ